MSPYIHVRQLASDIGIGENRGGILCPFCDGGSSYERSLSISRPDEATALFLCHRASCGKSGKVACWGFRLEQPSNTPPKSQGEPTRSVYLGNICELGSVWVSQLLRTFDLRSDDWEFFGWGEDLVTQRLVMPIRTQRGTICGTEVRKSDLQARVDGGQKTKNYFNDDSVRHNWFLRGINDSNKVVVVEDSLSACKVSRQYPAVAILGTHLNIDRIDDILKFNMNVVIALDPDATSKAIKYAQKFGIYGNFKVAVLSKDLKYESNEKIKELIEGAK